MTNKAVLVCFIVVLVSLLITLGFWQLQRAEQKQNILDQQQHQLALPAIEFNPDYQNLEDIHYRKVVMHGRYDCQHQILLDNKHYQHKPGFHVITALSGSKGKTSILINRGWIPMQSNRQPESLYQQCPKQVVRVEGTATAFPALGFHFESPADSEYNQWPKIELELDAVKLSYALGYPVTDYLVLSDPDNKHGFIRNWQIKPTISPQKHKAYAVQWFAMAIVLVMISLWKYITRHDNQIKQ
ncbi:MAG: SURF1 family protein [Gammaproteobacteria bacterium]|nr:SURF1 family protein [Gammaproteobacteria bacterium]